MLFNSFSFLIFFTVLFFIYWGMAQKYRWLLLLTASYFFYMCWRPEYALLLLFSTTASYVTGLLIERYRKAGKYFVWLNAVLCFSLLIYFKYLNFLCQSLASLFSAVSFLPELSIPVWDIILPVGISFLIFQNVGYTTDVYRKEVDAETHFGYYALFASFFPQLVAGPIERTKNLLPQFKQEHLFQYENAANGLRMILIGLFKKVAVADTIALYVDNVYNHVQDFTGLPLILATVLFAFQIYCDFSGYSDIAYGCAKMLDINLMINFKSPYLAETISEFWRRWHISLSTWFRDNIYIPLGGNRVPLGKYFRNVMTTFILSGIWHGAGWNFVIWGALHGMYICGGGVLKD